MKKKLQKSCIRSVVLYGSDTWTLGKYEERVVNNFKHGAGEEEDQDGVPS